MKLSLLKILAIICFLVTVYVINTSSSNGANGSSTTGCNCHGSAGLATSVNHTGFPTFYSWGQVYPITVTVTNAAKSKAGFKLSVNTGTLSSPGPGTSIIGALNAQHSTPKNMSSGTATWTFNWTAPTSGATILVVNCAGNAVDNSGTNTGDTWNFAKVISVPLPVTISSFNAYENNNAIRCDWTCENENSIISYTIEKSEDGLHFESIGNVTSQNLTQAKYSFYDTKSKFGNIYYRLKVNEIEGHYYYSKIIRYSKQSSKIYSYGGNTIFLNNGRPLKTTLYTITGIQIFTSTESSIDISRFTPGVYIMTIFDTKTNTLVATDKIIKQ